MTSIRLTNNDVQLNWNAPGGSNYVLQVVTPLSSNFVNLGTSNSVPAGPDQALSYTHVGARTSAPAGFYRLKALAPRRLEIQPTNVMIAPKMTNRYKVFFIGPDNVRSEVTTDPSLSFTSLNTTVAQFVRVTTNGFVTVRGINPGIASLRAVYQGVTNRVSLMVSNITGGIYTQPASFSGYVQGQSQTGRVFGVFGSRTVNITPATEPAGFGAAATRVDYKVAAEVANSFALVTGQSAANVSIVFSAGDEQTVPVPVTWCKFTQVRLQPEFATIGVGETQAFSIVGFRADGSSIDVSSFEMNTFSSSDDTIAQADSGSRRIVGISTGDVTIDVAVNNGAGCPSLFGSALVSVANLPVIARHPGDQTVIIGSNAIFEVTAFGSQPLSYQWQSNGLTIAGGTNASLVISNAGYEQEGPYRVVITNASGSVTSAVAILTVAQGGIPLWSSRYDGPGNESDGAGDVVADSSGNVIVVGYSYGLTSSADFATVKYTGSGFPLWTNRYGGISNGYDYANAVALDNADNVLVTGPAQGPTGTFDYTTIKYSAAGAPLWTNSYDAPGNSSDLPQAIALDGDGNVSITGYSETFSENRFRREYVTLKYSATGVPLWTNRFNESGDYFDAATGIAVDGGGNVFVTGYSYRSIEGTDYTTIKYSADGTPLWTNHYNGPISGIDAAQAILVDSTGNAVVTGYSANTSGYDYATIVYSGTGVPLWTNRYNGTRDGDDFAQAVALDRNGNVFVTGYSRGINGTYDYATIKYSGTGAPVWTNRYNGPGMSDDIVRAISSDTAGNVVVTGGSNGDDYTTIKYSASGIILWLDRRRGSASGAAVDASGNTFVTGYSRAIGGSSLDYETIKYSSSP